MLYRKIFGKNLNDIFKALIINHQSTKITQIYKNKKYFIMNFESALKML
jgi:hypothetical protein